MSSENQASSAASSSLPMMGVSEFAKLSGDMRASLGLLVENGICKINGNASLVVMPSTPNYDYSKSVAGGENLLNPLPASAKDIYLRNYGGSTGGRQSRPQQQKEPQNDEFFADNWYFVELHQSILQESTHSKERYSNL
ncbi:hypothetical protein FDP41_009526 [Naegleria fowleri]|uniref:Uncharacterized protein n=1 Tax=Naegleria fowleri TaxID=5763 RepID=A0A6A5BE43_NAEFO|nr:uncharacterized protein FDP41_009526 [Naegleria fowleri]KAF0972218.1 hypothetical protein FDP41_009526 [Naegleria fowleri]CAG4709334.1 unnamed protein product [Naegleria fowleri]